MNKDPTAKEQMQTLAVFCGYIAAVSEALQKLMQYAEAVPEPTETMVDETFSTIMEGLSSVSSLAMFYMQHEKMPDNLSENIDRLKGAPDKMKDFYMPGSNTVN